MKRQEFLDKLIAYLLRSTPQPAPVNIQVVNVTSGDDIPNAIKNGVVDEAIINAIARNKDRVSQVMQ